MGIALMFLLALYQMQSAIHSEIIEAPNYNDNALSETDVPNISNNDNNNSNNNNQASTLHAEILDGLLSDKPEQTELEFRYPISAIGIDYAKNSVVLRFRKPTRKQRSKYDADSELKRRSLQDNFMHFGKRQAEQLPQATGPGYFESVKRAEMDRYGRDPKQDFMRFGRAPSDFMRFGRAPSDFMRFGRDPKQDFMRFGRDPKQDFMRFGRDPKQDFMRFGRDPKQDFMRFGRSDNFIRFGRNMQLQEELRSPKQDFMRFGRPDNFMRFGRSSSPPEFERYGKMDSNFMRFGKSLHNSGADAGLSSSESNRTKSQLQQSKIEAANDKQQQTTDDSNPVDKAITMLFNKHHQQQQQQQQRQNQDDQQQLKSNEQNDAENTLEDGSVEQFYDP